MTKKTQTEYPKILTLEWLKRNEKPLYLRNTTRPRGQLGVNFIQPNGRLKLYQFDRTYLPVCLTERFSWDTILASDDLRDCLTKGVLDIVNPEEAERELSGADAVIEKDRMQLSQYSAKQQFVGKRVQDMQATIDKAQSTRSQTLEPLGIETDVIQPRILSLVEKLKTNDVSIKAALNELKIMEPELRETDCSYVIANGPDGQIRNYVQKVLGKIRSAGVSQYDFQEDDEPDMTPEERAAESQREAIARQYQNV